jgi:two-component system response regulator FlrC
VPGAGTDVAAGTPSAALPGAASIGAEPGLDRDLKERERELILATLRITGGSRKLAAERLGISPRTLRHKLQQLKAAGVIVPRLHEPSLATA